MDISTLFSEWVAGVFILGICGWEPWFYVPGVRAELVPPLTALAANTSPTPSEFPGKLVCGRGGGVHTMEVVTAGPQDVPHPLRPQHRTGCYLSARTLLLP